MFGDYQTFAAGTEHGFGKVKSEKGMVRKQVGLKISENGMRLPRRVGASIRGSFGKTSKNQRGTAAFENLEAGQCPIIRR